LEVKRNGKEKRKLKTILGEIERQKVRCKRCRRDFFHLDKELGIEKGIDLIVCRRQERRGMS